MKTAQDLVAAAKARTHEIGIDAAEAAIRDADVVIDVREPDEFSAGHIPGAVNIPRGLLEFKLGSLPEYDSRDLKVVLYCKTSGRAALAAQAMQSMGYLNVSSVAGGYDAWAAAGKPVVKPEQPAFD